MRFSPIQSLALMAAALGFPSLSRTLPHLAGPVLPPESDDSQLGEVVTIPKRNFDQERIEEAAARRQRKAEKKARNMALHKAGRDPLAHIDHRTIGQV